MKMPRLIRLPDPGTPLGVGISWSLRPSTEPGASVGVNGFMGNSKYIGCSGGLTLGAPASWIGAPSLFCPLRFSMWRFRHRAVPEKKVEPNSLKQEGPDPPEHTVGPQA